MSSDYIFASKFIDGCRLNNVFPKIFIPLSQELVNMFSYVEKKDFSDTIKLIILQWRLPWNLQEDIM